MGKTRRYMRMINFHRSIKMHLLRQTTLCGICGQEIKDLADATIDHIVPLSKGGTDQMANLRVAHELCNKMRGNLE